MRKKHWKTGGHILLFVLAIILLLMVCIRSNQTIAMPIPLTFQGEYSQAGGAWLPLEEDTELSALDGDLILRGHFDCDVPKDQSINFYLNHIAYYIEVNGEFVKCSSDWERETGIDICSRYWGKFTSPGIGTEDVVEIRLQNPHRLGNATAYSDFLNSVSVGATELLESKLSAENTPYRVAGLLIIVLSIGMLGAALACSLMRMPLGSQLWPLGLMSLFAGGYIVLDTYDVSLWSRLYVFNTYAQMLCMMLVLFELGVFLAMYLSTTSKKAARIAVCAEGLFLIVLVVLCLTAGVPIYDTLPFWIWAQLILCPVLLVCCVYEISKTWEKRPVMLIACAAVLLTVILECINVYFSWWPEGMVTELAFALFFVLYLAWGMKEATKSDRRVTEADKLADDLKNSQIILSMSQIRTHFIFNVLNAISGMCKYDPEKADQTVVRFARYLRTNLDIMQNDQRIPFHSELRHLEDYVALEQVRFGDKIRFVTDIAADHFMLPPLILQPIVENSIKHGLRPKPSGGTITLKTWKEGDNIQIVIQDDGVGFDPSIASGGQSVGLNNVRFRLHHMMHGKLEIESTPGLGTTATISIPCEEAEQCM